MKRFPVLFLGLILAFGSVHGGNLGNITSLRILKGADAKLYIEIGHASAELQAAANTDFKDAGTMVKEPIFIAWPADEAISLVTWSMLQKALGCQCIQFFAISGLVPPKGAITNSTHLPVLATEYRFLNR